MFTYIDSLALARAETRLTSIAQAQDDFESSVWDWNAIKAADRYKLLGAIINRGSQLLYVYGHAKVALRVIGECRQAMFSTGAVALEARLLNVQLRINETRLHRALGARDSVLRDLALLDSDIENALTTRRVTIDQRGKIESAARQTRWLERFKLHAQRREFADAHRIASSVDPPSRLIADCLLRCDLELGNYEAVLSWFLAQRCDTEWALPYLASALCRAGTRADVESVIPAILEHSDALGLLRVASELARLGWADRAIELCESCFARAVSSADCASAILAGALRLFLDSDWYRSPGCDVFREVLMANSCNVVRCVSVLSTPGCWPTGPVLGLLGLVDVDLLKPFFPGDPIEMATGSGADGLGTALRPRIDKDEALAGMVHRARRDTERVEGLCSDVISQIETVHG